MWKLSPDAPPISPSSKAAPSQRSLPPSPSPSSSLATIFGDVLTPESPIKLSLTPSNPPSPKPKKAPAPYPFTPEVTVERRGTGKKPAGLAPARLQKSPADTFTEKVLEAARASIPFHTNKGNRVRVPWFTTECREAIKNRKKAQRKYFNNPIPENFINFKRAIAKCRVVGHTDWGADRETLLKLYRTLVRSKLDYGSIVYGSAKKHILKTLDPIHHQGLRIALGAFRTSPVQSLYAGSGEPSLEHRRLKLSLNYAAKLNSIPENPGFESLSDSSPIEFFETKKSGPSLGARLQNHLEKLKQNENIDNVKVRKPPPWEQYNVKFDASLTEFEKGTTSAPVLQKEFLNLKEQYNEYYEIYTDGSKQDHKVAAAFFLPDDPGDSDSARLRDHSSVFSAELEAILMAMKM
ncbi:hypothetical protein EGW08_023664, partial [Elysia chlorotica]